MQAWHSKTYKKVNIYNFKSMYEFMLNWPNDDSDSGIMISKRVITITTQVCISVALAEMIR